MDHTFQRILILPWLTGSNRGLRARTFRANCREVFRSLRWSGEARTFSLKCPLQAVALGAPVALLRVPTRAFERKATTCLLHYFLWLRISLLKGRAEAFPYWLGLSTGSGVGWFLAMLPPHRCLWTCPAITRCVPLAWQEPKHQTHGPIQRALKVA